MSINIDKSWVDLVLTDLIICGNKPINEVIKATIPEHIIRDTFSSAQMNEIRFKGLVYPLSQIAHGTPNVQILFYHE